MEDKNVLLVILGKQISERNNKAEKDIADEEKRGLVQQQLCNHITQAADDNLRGRERRKEGNRKERKERRGREGK